jgi:stearoyl-CoA desaturase (delta-9 desaturase)
MLPPTDKKYTMLNLLKIKEYHQTSYVILVNQLLFLICLINFLPYWYICIPAMYMMGFFWEAGLHRYFAHNSYNTGCRRSNLLLVMSFLVGQGSILSWCNVHRHHHRWADTDKDPHSPYYLSYWRICTSLFINKCKANYVKNLLRTDKKSYLLFENNYYWLLWTLLWIVLYFIHPLLLFFVVGGSALWWWSVIFVNIFSHKKILGKSPTTDGVATNSKIINTVTGMGNHYNHHRYPASYTDTVTNEKFIYGVLIKHLFIKS